MTGKANFFFDYKIAIINSWTPKSKKLFLYQFLVEMLIIGTFWDVWLTFALFQKARLCYDIRQSNRLSTL